MRYSLTKSSNDAVSKKVLVASVRVSLGMLFRSLDAIRPIGLVSRWVDPWVLPFGRRVAPCGSVAACLCIRWELTGLFFVPSSDEKSYATCMTYKL